GKITNSVARNDGALTASAAVARSWVDVLTDITDVPDASFPAGHWRRRACPPHGGCCCGSARGSAADRRPQPRPNAPEPRQPPRAQGGEVGEGPRALRR